MNNTPTPPPGAVDKVFLVLRVFGSTESVDIGVSEIAQQTGLTKSTTHRILGELVNNGAVIRIDHRYRLGPVFQQLASKAFGRATQQSRAIAEILTPFLAALFERTRHTVHLACLEGPDVNYVNKLFSVNRVTAPSWIGGGVPAYCTGVGKALLAYDEALVEETIRRGLHPVTPNTITDPEVLRQELAQIRATGISYDHEENTAQLSCVAAPIFGRNNLPVAAMSVSVPTEILTPDNQETYVSDLRRICAAASKAYITALDPISY
ncbi:IclR family transcriptional regulator [Corynebacterium sp. S7]